MTYRSHKIAPNRYFDHLYDPLFTTSSWKDVARKNMISLRRSAPVQIFPVYQNMFTELMHESRNQYTLLQNPVPYIEVPLCEASQSAVTGTDRAKFFSNPVSNVHTINVRLAEPMLVDDDVPKLVSRSCQTTYRESSAQTTPWMPSAVVNGDETPEIVQVAAMLEGNNYPGVKEIELIERARMKKEWENQLPIPKSKTDVLEQEPVREAFEHDIWIQRETEIEKCQELRFQMVRDMMEEREKHKKEYQENRLEAACRRIERERDEKLEKLRQNHQRSIRKLEKKYKTKTKTAKKETDLPDFIETITVPLPPKRKVSPTMSKFESDYLAKAEYKPVANLKKFLSTRDPLWKPKEEIKETQKGLWSDKVLSELYDSLKHFRQMNEGSRSLPRCTVLISSPTESESTPPPQDLLTCEDEYQEAVLVQKYIKGRAIQNLIWRGREQCNDLIDELQSNQRIAAVRQLFEEKSEEIAQAASESAIKVDDYSENTENTESVANIRPSCHIMLEFLSKEIERLQEERKEHARQLLEERERHQMNTRKEEEVYRNIFKAEHDIVTTYLENVLTEGITIISEEEAREHILKVAENPKISQVLKYQIIPEILTKVPTSSFDLISDILNDFLSFDVMKKLENQELDTLEQTTTFMNEFVVPELLQRAAIHNVWTDTQKEEMQIASELIQEFVAPEIFKILAREKQKRARQAHLLAAHDAIWKALEELPTPIVESEAQTPKQCDSTMSLAEIEVHQLIDDCIYRAMKTVHGEEEDEKDQESHQLNLQKELLDRIVNNLKEKLNKQMEQERKRSSSRASMDIYLTQPEEFSLFPDDDDD